MVDKTNDKKYQPRTNQQNRALHKLFSLYSDELNDAGFDMKRTLKKDVDIPWTPENVKNFLWRPVQAALLNKKSTTELTTVEIDQVFEVLNRHLAEVTGLHVAFPSIEEMIFQQEQERSKRG